MTSHLLPRRAWFHDILGLALIFALMVIPTMLAMEAIYSYNRLGSYATAFHETRPERRTPENLLLREFNAYVGALITAVARRGRARSRVPGPHRTSHAPRPATDPPPDPPSSTWPWRQGVTGAIVGSALTMAVIAWWRNRRP